MLQRGQGRTGQPQRIGVVALTTTLSHISGCCCQHRQHAASELPPTTAPTKTSPHCLGCAGGTCCCCVMQNVYRAELQLRRLLPFGLKSAGCSSFVLSVCCWAEKSGKCCSSSRLRQSFLTTTPLRATEWTSAKYSKTLGQWRGSNVWMCIICGCGQVQFNTFQLKLVQIDLWV